MDGGDIILLIIAIIFPPLTVLLKDGCTCCLLLNILLTILGWIPGMCATSISRTLIQIPYRAHNTIQYNRVVTISALLAQSFQQLPPTTISHLFIPTFSLSLYYYCCTTIPSHYRLVVAGIQVSCTPGGLFVHVNHNDALWWCTGKHCAYETCASTFTTIASLAPSMIAFLASVIPFYCNQLPPTHPSIYLSTTHTANKSHCVVHLSLPHLTTKHHFV
jgi:uncharacterized membrane protein YqaE (UPF0057 family)